LKKYGAIWDKAKALKTLDHCNFLLFGY